MPRETVLEQVSASVEKSTRNFGNFLSVQNDVAAKLRTTMKQLYDLTKLETARKNSALPELVVQGFDEEQIWQQLELQNEGELLYFLGGVSRALAGNNKLELPVSLVPKENDSIRNESYKDKKESGDECADMDLEESDEEMNLDMDFNGELRKKKEEGKKRITRPSIVDDQFFKLEELDEYLNKEDKKESHKSEGASSDESDEESVDLFEPASDEEEDENESENEKMMKYADFFDSPDSAEAEEQRMVNLESHQYHDADDHPAKMGEELEIGGTNKKEEGKEEKRVKFNLTNDSDETDSLEIYKNEKSEEINQSSLENRQERLQMRIQELERQAISEKPWQLKGEIAGSNRPQNSLLEEYVEFDFTSRPAPVITEQTTLKLENIIKQRIKDKAWDDVERKFRPVETPLEYKKKLVMDQEKSKKSLAQIYEDAYVQQRDAAKNPDENDERQIEEPKEHIEIRHLMHSLFAKLDSLSNFHYTPKQAQPEVKIISNQPAINMEEVAPVATTDATLLAPEEIKSKPRGELVGRAERTSTDMKRERRKKKLKQRVHQKASEKKEASLSEKLKASGRKYSKGEATAVINKLSKAGNVVKIDETNSKVPKSSTAFFAQLQDQVTSQIKIKTGNALKKKRDKNVHSAVKLKL